MSLRGTLGKLFGGAAVDVPGTPEADLVVAPTSVTEVARLLDFASEHGLVVLPWGAGSHQGLGYVVEPDVVLVTTGLDRVEAWQPDDLTVVVDSGVTLRALSDRIENRRQSAVLPEDQPDATVGGVIASGSSPWRRLRYGPTRNRLLEVTVVTGDGRVIRGGGRVVKNVTGYDLPRLMVGSLGSLGLITSVCLKLWPEPERIVTVVVDDAQRAVEIAHRPFAILQTAARTTVHLGGTNAEVEAQAGALGGEVLDGHEWPRRPDGEIVVSLRVPPASLSDGIARLTGNRFVAAHGVGEVLAAVTESEVLELRQWAEEHGGAVVVVRAPSDVRARIDPWGTPPGTVALQRRIKVAFDPIGVMAPGRLPGGV